MTIKNVDGACTLGVMLCGLVRIYQHSSETLVSTCRYTWHDTPEDQHRHLHHHEEIRFHYQK